MNNSRTSKPTDRTSNNVNNDRSTERSTPTKRLDHEQGHEDTLTPTRGRSPSDESNPRTIKTDSSQRRDDSRDESFSTSGKRSETSTNSVPKKEKEQRWEDEGGATPRGPQSSPPSTPDRKYEMNTNSSKGSAPEGQRYASESKSSSKAASATDRDQSANRTTDRKKF